MKTLAIALGIVTAVAVAPALEAQGPGCPHGGQGAGTGQGKGMQHGKGMHADDPAHAADRDMIHFLVDHRDTITRTVSKIDAGVDTLTESSDPKVAQQIRDHVASMTLRIAEGKPIHQRDPLFVEIFKHADRIEMAVEQTEKGVRVRETSKDPKVVALIQAHADVIDGFLENGYAELRTDHPIPAK